MAETVNPTPGMEAGVNGVKFDTNAAVGITYQNTIGSDSKGSVSIELFKLGSSVAKATSKFKDLPASPSELNLMTLSVGAEADNSTETEIIYVLDATALGNGEYTFNTSWSGNMDIQASQGGGWAASIKGKGHVDIDGSGIEDAA